ncbi:MAG: hypothetical protein HFG28_10275 [Eubacterium sp.]|nr:hypothetical protein [Eubacterium sp.]
MDKDFSVESLKGFFQEVSLTDIKNGVIERVNGLSDYLIILQDDIMEKIQICDKYDYAFAVFSGLVSGLIDSFFVGMPGKSRLGTWTDRMADSVVQKFAQLIWANDKANGKRLRKPPKNIAAAIGFLERRSNVNYDARFAKDLTGGEELINNFNAKNHHLKSLAHSPDLIGLFFSILDQFTNKTTVLSDGKIIRLESNLEKNKNFELYGNNFIQKIACGFVNWVCHCMSDVAGSSGTRGHDGTRGMGIPIPGFELFQFANRNINEEQCSLAKLTEEMFLKGYDARFGCALQIPVVINDIMIKLFWALRQRYGYQKSWKECFPHLGIPEVRRMLLAGTGTLCAIDAGDAIIKSGGQLITFALHINYNAFCKLAFLGIREIRYVFWESSKNQIEEVLEEEWKMLFD